MDSIWNPRLQEQAIEIAKKACGTSTGQQCWQCGNMIARWRAVPNTVADEASICDECWPAFKARELAQG